LRIHCLADPGDVLVDLAIARSSGEQSREVPSFGEEEDGKSDGESMLDGLINLVLHCLLLLPLHITLFLTQIVGYTCEQVAKI
jgi:hypothetical protein